MRIKLLFPPHFIFDRPYLSLPALSAFLRRQGMEVSLDDLNVASLDYFMRPGFLGSCQEKVEAALRTKNYARTRAHREFYWESRLSLLAAPLIIERIEPALQFFRTRDGFFDLEAYTLNRRILTQAFELISAAFYPILLGLQSLSFRYSPESSQQILAALDDLEHNPYYSFFEDYVEKKLAAETIDLVGLSLVVPSQLIPALNLARIIRQKLPHLKIVVGGAVPSLLFQKIRRLPGLFSHFDYLIEHEGETPLLRLGQHLAGDCPITRVPNLLYAEGGELKGTGLRSIEKINELPVPDFTGLPLEKYLTPWPVLSLEAARGCYWRKCSFCNSGISREKSLQIRAPEKLAEDMATLEERHGICLLDITNEGLPAKYFSELAEAILRRDIRPRWFACARLEKEFTYARLKRIRESGCCKLCFGLESGSQRLLDLMRKGIRLEQVPGILEACRQAEVDIHLYLMVGFPTESIAEIRQTRDLVFRLLQNADKEGFTFCVSLFLASINSPVFGQMQELGYQLISKGPDFDLELFQDYQPLARSPVQLSQEDYRQLAEQLVIALNRRLPPLVLGDASHYLICRAFPNDHLDLRGTVRAVAESECKIQFLKGQPFRLSPWVALRNLSLRDADTPTSRVGSFRSVRRYVAYDLRADRCFSLNKAAALFLENLRTPKCLDDLVGPGRTRFGEMQYVKKALRDLLKRGLIEALPPQRNG